MRKQVSAYRFHHLFQFPLFFYFVKGRYSQLPPHILQYTPPRILVRLRKETKENQSAYELIIEINHSIALIIQIDERIQLRGIKRSDNKKTDFQAYQSCVYCF